MLILKEGIELEELKKYGFTYSIRACLPEDIYVDEMAINYYNGYYFEKVYSHNNNMIIDDRIMKQYNALSYKWVNGILCGGKTVPTENKFNKNQKFKDIELDEITYKTISHIVPDYIFNMIQDGILIKVDDKEYIEELKRKGIKYDID